MQEIIQNIINGLAQGSVYALVALGYTMVYGVLQFINFAHSDIFMMGAFAGILITAFLTGGGAIHFTMFGSWMVDLKPWFSPVHSPTGLFLLATMGAMLFCVALALTIERIAYRPLRSAPRLNVLITAIGVSLFLENFGQVIFGSDPRVFPPLIPTFSLTSGEGLVLNNIQVTVILLSAVLMFVLNWVVHHTKMGIAMRAVSYDIEIANLMGIPTDRIISFTFIMGSLLAGVASILYGISYPKIEPLLGVMIGLKAFVAAVFGGIGSIMGAAVGGIVLGLAEAFTVYYISSSFRDAIAFAILILILLFKPAGLFGTFRREKV